MWPRAVSLERGAVAPDVLACYREFDANDTGRLKQIAENLRDYLRFYEISAGRLPGFSWER